ncbi:unnamed protein product, partial [Musa acuminata subsp. burmannicoides]
REGAERIRRRDPSSPSLFLSPPPPCPLRAVLSDSIRRNPQRLDGGRRKLSSSNPSPVSWKRHGTREEMR